MRIYLNNLRYSLLICIGLYCALMIGCSGKKYYEPKEISGQIIFDYALKSPIQSNNRYSATLQDGSLLTQNGIIPYSNKIPKKAQFLGESSGYYLFDNECKEIILIKSSVLDSSVFESGVCDLKAENSVCTQEQIHIKTEFCATSATLKDDLLAIISNENSSIIYQIPSINNDTQEMKFSQKGSSVLAVNQLIAAPLFLETLVVFPTLDGRLLVVSLKDFEVQRNIIIGGDKFFNNVIYLSGDDTRIFAATARKIISIVSGQEFSYEGELLDVFFDGKYVYTLSIDGRISQLDHTLREVNTLHLPFASLEGIIVLGDTLYTFEQHGGYMIAISLGDFSHKVYGVQDSFGKLLSNKLNFYSKNIFYYDKYYFDIARLR